MEIGNPSERLEKRLQVIYFVFVENIAMRRRSGHGVEKVTNV